MRSQSPTLPRTCPRSGRGSIPASPSRQGCGSATWPRDHMPSGLSGGRGRLCVPLASNSAASGRPGTASCRLGHDMKETAADASLILTHPGGPTQLPFARTRGSPVSRTLGGWGAARLVGAQALGAQTKLHLYTASFSPARDQPGFVPSMCQSLSV